MRVKKDQSIFDLCIQEFGELEQLFVMLKDNSLNPNSKLKSGQELVINSQDLGDQSVKDFVILQQLSCNNYQQELFPPNIGGDYNNDYNNDYN